MLNDCEILKSTHCDNHIVLGICNRVEAANATNTKVVSESINLSKKLQFDLLGLRRMRSLS